MPATTRSTAHRLGIMTIVAAMVTALLALVAIAPARAATAGDIVITEVMQNPNAVGDSAGEWFEVYNTTGAPIDLNGWTVSDGGIDTFSITVSVLVGPGAYAVLGNNADGGTNGGVTVAFEYSGMFLSNGDDEIILTDAGATEIDRIQYDGGTSWPDPTGASMSLDPASTDSGSNDSGANWCEGTTAYGAGDLGTPGAANPSCGGPPPPASVNPGDVIITEVMQNPAATADGDGEWFEVHNTTGSDIDLNGWTIKDNDSDSFGVASSVIVPAGGRAVFSNNGDSASNGGVTVDYAYSGMFLSNSADELVLEAPGPVTVDSIEWDGGPVWPDPNGKSMTLDPTKHDSASNDAGSNWCEATSVYGGGDFGTPGAANDSCGLGGGPVTDPLINEYVADHTGVDTHEFVEVLGDAGTDYSAYTVLEIEGDTTSNEGTVDGVYTVGTTDGAGYWTTGFLSNGLENGTVTILLVENFSGSEGDDLDIDDDGVLDTTPWTRIVDSVGIDEGGVAYGTPNLVGGFDGISFDVSGASRIPNGVDTDSPGDWMRNHYFGAGLPGFVGTPSVGEAWNTPGAVNEEYVPAFVEAFIHDVQGSGSSVAISGGVIVQGIVTSLFENDDVLEGFFLQEEDADADTDPATSEGIYVHCDAVCPVGLATADLVTVQGQAEEYFGMSQIDANDGGSVVIDSSGNPLPAATVVNMPAAGSTVAEATFEATEGMLVTFPDTLVVSEYFQLARFGQIVLTESSRPYQFTHSNAPSVGGYATFLDDLATRRIILDDNNNDNNDFIDGASDEPAYFPTGGLSTGNKFRGGDTITDMVGVLHWSWAGGGGTDAWRVRPVASADYSFTSVNPEPGTPADVGGDLKVASFNVLNYFTTIDVTSSNSSGDCGPTGTADCRGADSEDERLRQRAKILSALSSIDADVVGLVELENDGDDSSIADLVAGLPGYGYIATGFIGTDAIKVGLIYKTGTVSPEGAYAILDSAVDPTFIDTKNRPALIQTFSENATGEKFTVAVNHFKSKGSGCDDVGDPGLNDGQGSCPGVRAAAATALANYLATDPTGSGDPDFMILGDLNAYAQEDAIAALEAAGYTNLLAHFGGPTAYSYVFDGQLGYLDYALANESLLGSVTDVAEWHINADEVPVFDYNDDIRDAGEASFERETTVGPLYAPDALRSSDHDPVVVGLNLANPMGDKEDVLADLLALIPSGDDHTDKHLARAIEHLEHSLNPDYWTSDQTIDNKKVFDEGRKTVKELGRAVDHGILNEALAEDLMDMLVNADRILARVAIISAESRGVSQKDIDEAEKAMAKAAHYWADGRYDKAIDEYKKAWETVNKNKHL